MESIVGQTVSHYVFVEKLGAGGMGEIYKARDSRLNRIVAVKVLSAGRTRDPQRRRRFIQEAQAASALNHPNIVTIHDILPEGDTQYMVMEHVSGQTLSKMIAAGRMPVPQVLQIATQMANALAAAHAAGIIHRDLKPANVMVTESGLVKILDFGLAKLMDPGANLRSEGDSSESMDPATLTQAPLTVEGSIMGTVNYMAPEQAEGLKVDARADIFSFGALLYEMVTGHRAFDGDSGISTLSKVLRDDVKPIRDYAPEVPAELDDLITHCLRKNPAQRWQSMSEVATALNSMRTRLNSGATLALREPEPEKLVIAEAPAAKPATITAAAAIPSVAAKQTGSKKWMLLGAVCFVVVAAGIGAAWWQMHRPSPQQQTPPPTATAAQPAVPPAPPAPAQAQNQPDQQPTTDAANQITAAAPPPPSTPVVALPNHTAPVAPPVVSTIPQPKPKAAAAAVPVLPIPRAPGPAQIVPVTLGDGVPFRIVLSEDVPTDTEVGNPIHFRALDDLKAGDVVVIAKGSIVTGAIAVLGGKRNFFGERSKVRFRLISAVSVDDGRIDVRATPAAKNDGAESRPFTTPNGSAHDLKDKNLIAASGTEFVAYIAGAQTVNIHK